MNQEQFVKACRIPALIISSVIVLGCASKSPTIDTSPTAEVSFDGLHKVLNSAADEAWARPGLDLSGYTKIRLQSTGIEYRPGGESSRLYSARVRTGGPFEVTEKNKERLQALMQEVFLEELGKGKKYTIVNEIGPDVLLVRGGLLDVVSYVPPEPIGRSDIYLSRVGEATLVLELRDSVTDAILARSIDRRAAEPVGQDLRWSTPVTNRSEVRRLARLWAKRLREGLDAFMGP